MRRRKVGTFWYDIKMWAEFILLLMFLFASFGALFWLIGRVFP